MIPGSINFFLLEEEAVAGGYAIERSLRFNSSDSAYLSRTPASAGNRKTWTWAGWVKRSALGSGYLTLFSNLNASNTSGIHFTFNADFLQAYDYGTGAELSIITTAVYRDVAAWYHVVLVFDSTQATAANRAKIYVNGIEQSLSSPVYPSLNADGLCNTAQLHAIGRQGNVNANYFNGYLADIHFIDGQALDPTSFGEFDDNGIWQPIAYSGSYGTNGFHLDFADNSTAAALGTDTSGNGNTWTVNNISVTAGAGNDSLVDVPTNGTETDTGVGGEVRGNYCTWNPLDLKGTTLSNGNLQAAGSDSSGAVTGTIAVSSGKWYWEITAGSAYDMPGIWSTSSNATSYPGAVSGSHAWYGLGGLYGTGAAGTWPGTFTTNDVIGVALDCDAGTLAYYKNGTSLGTAFTGLSGAYRPAARAGHALAPSSATYINAGQRPFAYTAPSGFKALCTANLPAPVVTKPSEYMDVALYTGNGSTQTISGLGFSPDLVWIKLRAPVVSSHVLADSVRGSTNIMYSNLTNGEGTDPNSITSFNSDGFSIGSLANVNYTSSPHVAWTWDAGSSTVTNTDGSITSSVRANPSAGFSVVTYTGTGSNATVGHGLNVAPSLIIVKCRSAANDWAVYHAANTADPKTDYLLLNSTAATADDNTYWNDTAPTSTVFSIGTNADVNTSAATYVAYCWTGLDGYSNGFSYTGNGSADGSFVYLGFRPRLILLKCSSTTGNWTLLDTAREGYNVDNDPLYPNLSNAEGTADLLDITSNGFKLRTTDASVNANAATYVGFAWAESPFNYSRAR